jgi:tRNA-2-methylthio-N6-dimethylallyladenosine synthase
MGRYIHLPVQAGHDALLERMKRKVTVEEYWQRVGWLRAIDPEMALSTDIIVGFPGETEEEFEGTLKLVEAVRYSFIFAFKYSPRKGTAAARFRDHIPDDVMSRRLAALNQLQDRITIEMNTAEIGRQRRVLVHYQSRKDPGFYYGRTDQFRLVKIASQENIVGHQVDVKIIDANKTALVGNLI